jgi:hypothetical protein
MTVKPDVMDGVPDKPGYYGVFINGVEPRMAWVYRHYEKNRLMAAVFQNGQLEIDSRQFDKHEWTEKIILQPPEVE